MAKMLVCARFRPLSVAEQRQYGDLICIRRIDDEKFVIKDERHRETTFTFDRVFYGTSTQEDVYSFLAKPIVEGAVGGINGTILAYGQTGAGKTFTVEGYKHDEGLFARAVHDMFELLNSCDEIVKYSVGMSMLEVYMEKVRDLLTLNAEVQLQEVGSQGVLLRGASVKSISSVDEALDYVKGGVMNRAVGGHDLNKRSSRSHCLYILTVQAELSDTRKRRGKLILVDLAGSERASKTRAEGQVLQEARAINKSLSSLGNVINALTSGPRVVHIPYRDSKLTLILKDCLGGNCRTALLCCCSPSPSNASETVFTLLFGTRAAHIRSSPRVNYVDEGPSQILPAATEIERLGETPEAVMHPPAPANTVPTIAVEELEHMVGQLVRQQLGTERATRESGFWRDAMVGTIGAAAFAFISSALRRSGNR